MSINSIDHSEMSKMAEKWDFKDEVTEAKSANKRKSAEARRRIEMLREIKESGLTLEEAEELGLLH
ncbi:conserved hypothetical protein [Vibrio nigripulchritudo MADA3029]|uniref:Uncharacterized protein n=2 Tax=Vibrio nigripulchritudo TaxID=28173 RepID=U4K945_9VIBR|nr:MULTISPECIES: hypothetical protein [Vibrio]EGU57526.1 hypothetical protein VINI7043_06920 [Vibrio nigripulchritudo ATCC 27043]KJY79651.1 hypothetical protein TW74_09445 [Vibrio nigripulchritudo]UAB73261.1 hypothetical protein INR79_19005 [Vibrio sp. SCSIO 43132]CCN36617.1 conserved hypothetical protein [Vibrio nigripulchritudo AM115]CCN43836.1 conserved hypothetical protein [Vibrio nigripulchritudo FTn2]